MTKSTAQFTLFPCLPPELRYLVWEQCLPGPQIVELAMTALNTGYAVVLPRKLPWTQRLSNARLPAIARVCSEARKIALKPYHYDEEDRCHVGFRPAIDAIFLDWWNDLDIIDGVAGISGRPVWDGMEYLVSVCSHLKIQTTPCIGALYTGQQFACVDLGQKRYSKLDPLACADEWMVALSTVLLKVSDQEAQDLPQGLWGGPESRIRIVDAFDSVALQKYCYFWMSTNRAYDASGRSFFTLFATATPQECVKLWIWQSQIVWLYEMWTRARNENRPGLPSVSEAFLHEDVIGVDALGYHHVPNKNNPWVQATLKQMPRLRPVMVFRLQRLEDQQETTM